MVLSKNEPVDNRFSDLQRKSGSKTLKDGTVLCLRGQDDTGLFTFCRYLATKARCESRYSLVSIISPFFSLVSYS